jgi:hypothetical protein
MSGDAFHRIMIGLDEALADARGEGLRSPSDSGACTQGGAGENLHKRVPLPAPVAMIYKATAELAALYPDRPFTPDGHLVGSIGEVVAAEALGLTHYTRLPAPVTMPSMGAETFRSR